MTLKEQIYESVIANCDPKLDPANVLEDLFKYTVAEMLKVNVAQNNSRISAGFIQALCAYLIGEFREVELDKWQKSEQQYAELFNLTIKEILNDAGHGHEGEDSMEAASQQLMINKQLWNQRSSGIVVPGSGR